MVFRLIFLASAVVLCACNPQGEQITLGPPANKALTTTELAADGKKRLSLLAAQTDLQNNAIFTAYRPKTVSEWSNGWTRRIDFSGVSWTKRQAGTAITPRHIVFAAHYTLKPGTTITFHERTGKVHSRKIEKFISFRGSKVPAEYRSDIAVALLDRALPPTIKPYRLLPPRTDYPHTLPGSSVVVTEQGRRAYIHEIRKLYSKTISFTKNKDLPEGLYKSLIKGDSGHPSFLLVGGEPVLIETHTGGGPGSGPFYSDPALFKALQEAVAKLDPNYTVRTVPLDPKLAPAPPEVQSPALQKMTSPTPTPPGSDKNQPNNTSSPQRVPRVRRVPAPIQD